MSDASLKYIVEIELQRTGDGASEGVTVLTQEIDKAHRSSVTLAGSISNIGTSAASAFMSATEAIGKYASIAATAGFGLLTHSAMQFDAQMEKTHYSLATILQVGGQSANFTNALSSSSTLMKELRHDAATLPGSFQDLMNIFQTISTTGFSKGMSVGKIRDLSSQAMAAGASMGLHSAMVGRELAMAMEGRVGSHNVLATRLGISGAEADKFRALPEEKRIDYLLAKFAKYKDAVAAFGDTWDAISSTSMDNWKTFLGDTSTPLFEAVKAAVKDINEWFDKNQATITLWAHRIGSDLESAFLTGRRIFETYWPAFAAFAENAYAKVHSMWAELSSTYGAAFEKVGGIIQAALKDPGTIDKIIEAMKIYAALKGASLLGGMGVGVGGKLGGAANALGSAVNFGVAGYVGGRALGAYTHTEGLENVGAGAAGGAALGGSIGGPMGAVLGGEIGAIIGEFIIFKKGLSDLVDQNVRTAEGLLMFNQGIFDASGHLDKHSKAYADAVREIETSTNIFSRAFMSAADTLEFAAAKMGLAAANARLDAVDRARLEMEEKIRKAVAASRAEMDAEARKKHDKERADAAARSGSTNITINVTQTISGAQAPGQIARRSAEFIRDMASKGAASRRSPNYSQRSRG